MSMRSMTCLCCGNSQMLRHVRANGVYWFCMSCRQEVPLIKAIGQPSRDSRTEPSGIRPPVEVSI